MVEKKTPKSDSGIMVNHIIFVLDNSGSMGHLRSDTINNMNEQIGQLKIDAEKNHVNLVSLVTFNSKVRRLREIVPLSAFEEIKLEEYQPGGWTALYDGVGEAIMLADQGFEKYDGMNNSALIIILSDGMENRSVEFDRYKIAAIVKDRQDKGRFTFTFLGCGQYILQQAAHINIPLGNTEIWAPNAVGMAMTAQNNMAGTKSYFNARNAGEMACSGFYDVPHVTGIDDFEDENLFPQGPVSGYADSPYNHLLTSGTKFCYPSLKE